MILRFCYTRKPPAVPVVLKSFSYAQFRRSGKPPLCKGRWAKSLILLGGVVRIVTIPQSPQCGDSCLRAARSAALTVHRTVIHYRRLRFAYPLHKGAFGAYLTASAVVGHHTQEKENSMSL